MPPSPKSVSKARGAVLLKAALEALKEAGGSLPWREVRAAVERKVPLTPHDLQRYEKSGYIRWQSVLHFYSVDATKAGFIRKSAGIWHLTDEGLAALEKPAEALLEEAIRGYRSWRADQPEAARPGPDPLSPADEESLPTRTFVLETAEGEAQAEIEEYVNSLGPYEMQDLVASLLRGMGYAIAQIAPPGPDGGTDILAYPDPLGAQTPHVRVQVKHRAAQKAGREEIAALRGILRQGREIGLFFSSSGFSAQAINEARGGTPHVQLMDLASFLESWVANYPRLSEEDRARLRLQPVYFLAPK